MVHTFKDRMKEFGDQFGDGLEKLHQEPANINRVSLRDRLDDFEHALIRHHVSHRINFFWVTGPLEETVGIERQRE